MTEAGRARSLLAATAALMSVVAGACAREPQALCSETTFDGAPYVVCAFDAAVDDIRLFHSDDAGEPWRHFSFLKDALEAQGETLLFAMNAGMYHEDRSPVGLYVENGEANSSLNTNDGPGNFHLKPNGVFYLTADGAGVLDSDVFAIKEFDLDYATQSGPMLVIDGAIHPKFLEDSDSKKRRNGVGVMDDGRTVYFAISDAPVTFHEFARLFRDELKTPNALFLDGSISRLYAPELDRNEPGAAMGPIVGVVASHAPVSSKD